LFVGKSLRTTAARRGLAGGEVGAGASGLHTIASQGFPGVCWLEGTRTKGATAVVARFTAEPGSSPWAAASTAPAVGLRTRERVYGGWLGAFGATKDAVSSFIPYPR
jgi:hypothetical protein